MYEKMIKEEASESKISGTRDNSFGVAGVIFGVLSILSLSVGGVVMGIVGLFFSLKQKKIMKNKWSNSGIVLNIIGIIVGLIAIYVLFNYATDYIAQFQGG